MTAPITEREYDVKAVEVAAACPKCMFGELEAQPTKVWNSSPLYLHVCSNRGCRHELALPTSYPRIEHRRVYD